MGMPDLYGKTYFDDAERFAALFNGILYHGDTMIAASELEDAGTEVIDFFAKGAKQQIIDNAKWWRGQLLVLLLLENQHYVDYHMVLRAMQMEAAQYMSQWRELRKGHRQRGDLSKGDEYLSGMKREEKFQPVILLTVYYDPQKAWDGARSLHELLLMGDDTKQMSSFINNYKLNLFDFHEYDDFSNFPEPLCSFFGFLRYSTEKENLQEYMEQNRRAFQKLDQETAIFLSLLTSIQEIEKYKIEEEGEVTYDMCKAFEDMKLEGIEQGIGQGIKQGLEQGLEQSIRSLMTNMKLSLAQAMDALSIPAEDQPMYAARIHRQ